MPAKREPLIEDEELYLDIHFRRTLLLQMSPKKRMKFLQEWAEQVAFDKVQPLGGARASPGCIARANAALRRQIPLLLRPNAVTRRP